MKPAEREISSANKDFEGMNDRGDDIIGTMASIDARFGRDANSDSPRRDMGDDGFGESRPADANIEPTEREISAAGKDLKELLNDNSCDGNLLDNRNVDGCGRSKSDPGNLSSPARFRRRTEGDNSLSSADSMPLDKDAAVVNVYNLPELRSSAPTTLFKHNIVKRCLSSTSLVNMLMIQPICEQNELHDDIRGYNLEETVQMQGMGAATIFRRLPTTRERH